MQKITLKALLVTLFCLLGTGDALKILFMAPFPVPSHWFWLKSVVDGLLDRGHEVTAITNFRAKEPHSNYTEIILDPPFDLLKYSPEHYIYELKYRNDFSNLFLVWNVGLLSTKYALEHPKVARLIRSDTEEFDLVISEQFGQEAFLMFARKYNAPIVTISTYDFTDFLDLNAGFRAPASFIPHILLPYTDEMTLSQRAYNLFISLCDRIVRRIFYIPAQNALLEKHFKPLERSLGPLPTVQELEQSISVILFNSHAATSPARPEMPGHVKIGGIHIRDPKPLPAELQKFLDGADHGAVLFSLGSHIQSSHFAKEKIQAFIKVFAKMKQRIIWKYEGDDLKGLTPNVLIQKWIPQVDVLAHHNIVLFINHGGIFGTQESVHYGVPMLTIPFYADQFRNAYRAQARGHALVIEYDAITEENLSQKLHSLLTENHFQQTADKVSQLFKDNLESPLNTAMYWIEYVGRNRGADHLKSAARNLNWFQYFMLDIIGLLIVVYFVIATAMYFLVERICGKKKKTNEKDKKVSKQKKSN
ncbi:UDP-glucosyltransferase 2 [Phlebotomus argentipes]|uniref:UDP-glucosyltransferase 2 n=1 Tax=Phlebotomus argentipes TaxID=94469 RepID=UPI00289364C4|nr:UDP-glucosyltransferase 2 [Phlebotomus argentipes]